MAMHIFANKISKNEPIEVYNNGNVKGDLPILMTLFKVQFQQLKKTILVRFLILVIINLKKS